MHMADALISPAVGGAFCGISAGMSVRASRRIARSAEADARSTAPLMGVLGAFVFSAQMLNFAIPFTGSSGHIGGGILLAALLGADAAFIVICSVLIVQALFFADGGLLALGCNIFNMGLLVCYIAYPLVFRPLARSAGRRALWAACIGACAVAMPLGAFGVVVETRLSGISDLPLVPFLLLMLPIHLVIGIIEGCITALTVDFLRQAVPELVPGQEDSGGLRSLRALLLVAVVVGGGLSLLASSRPDGLEWAVGNVAGTAELSAPADRVHSSLRDVQQKTVLMPDYALPETEGTSRLSAAAQTSLAGITGGALTLLLAGAVGLLTRRRRSATV